jgi:hypothetical protein
MIKNRFYKSTLGENAEVLVAKNVAYTTDATVELFVANAVEGEVGIYNVTTGALLDGLAAATAGDKLIIIQKKDGVLFQSSPFVFGTDAIEQQVYVAPVKQTTVIAIAGTIAVGDELQVTVIELTPGKEPFPRFVYNRVCATTTLATEVTALVALINNADDPTNKDQDPVVDATVTDTDNITLISKDASRIFRIAVSGRLAEISTNSITVKPKHGSGSYDQVSQMERIGNIFAGHHAEYTDERYTSAEFGEPAKFAASGLLYDIILITRQNTEVSPTPKQKHFHQLKTFFCVPTVGGPKAAVDTILV